MKITKCCAAQELHVEQMQGMLVFRRVGRKKVYSAKCAGCGKKFDLPQLQASRAVKRLAANRRGKAP